MKDSLFLPTHWLRWAVIPLALLVLLPAAGCWDYREPDEVAWVTAIGLDKGRENLLRVSLQIAVPKDIAGGGGGGNGGGGDGGPGFFVAAMDVPSIDSALEIMNAFVDRQGDLSHTKVLVISRELAEEDVTRYLMTLNRFWQFRPTTTVLISQDSAEETLRKTKPVLENDPGKYWELITAGWEYTEFIPRDTFRIVDASIRTPGRAAFIPLVGLQREEPGTPDPTFKSKGEQIAGSLAREGGVELDFFGMATLVNGRMVGTLNGDETGIVKFVRGNNKRTTKHVVDPHQPDRLIIVRITPREDPDIEIDIPGDGPPRIRATIPVEGNIVSIQGETPWDVPERIPQLEELVMRSLNEDARTTVRRTQEMGADVFGFGWQAKRQFLTWQEWEDYRWGDKFPHAEIEISFDFQIRQAGLVHEARPLYPQ